MTQTPITIEEFEKSCINEADFDHAAHVQVAWLYLAQFPFSEAIIRFDAALRRLVAKMGAENKYHATLTWFFLLLIAEKSRPGESWQEFSRNNSSLLTDSEATIGRYYTNARLFSDSARQHFVLPDPAFADFDQPSETST